MEILYQCWIQSNCLIFMNELTPDTGLNVLVEGFIERKKNGPHLRTLRKAHQEFGEWITSKAKLYKSGEMGNPAAVLDYLLLESKLECLTHSITRGCKKCKYSNTTDRQSGSVLINGRFPMRNRRYDLQAYFTSWESGQLNDLGFCDTCHKEKEVRYKLNSVGAILILEISLDAKGQLTSGKINIPGKIMLLNAQYVLKGVILHNGKTFLSSGSHYTALIDVEKEPYFYDDLQKGLSVKSQKTLTGIHKDASVLIYSKQ